MPESLKEKTVKGVVWSSIERFSSQGVNFILGFIIARQLSPSDYGLMAMLSIFLAIAQSFIDSGFSNALIQKQNRTDTDYSTVFYFNIVVALLMYVLFCLISPAVAAFYGQEELKRIMPWVGINFIISSFATVQRAKLTIELDFRRQAVISLSSVVVSGAAGIWLAYNGFGVWTLVIQNMMNNAINTVLLWGSAKWHPKAVFSMQSFKELFGFGSKLLIGGLLQTLYINLYSLVIGKVYSASQLGLYNRAFSIAQYPSSNISNILTRVTYPVECKIQDRTDALREKYFLFIRFTAFAVFPMMLGLVAIADPMIRLVLTDKWAPCIPYLRIMCLAYMWDPIMRMSWDLLNVKHRSDLSLRSEIFKKAVAFAILFATLPFGLEIICVGLILYSFSDLFIITRYTRKVVEGVTFRAIMRCLLPIFLEALVMGAIVYLFTSLIDNLWISTFGGIALGIVLYGLMSEVFNRDILREIKNIRK